MTAPRVSIILPTYNGARYLAQSIESCLTQTYPHIEIIVVDDCSSDDTSVLLGQYHDPRLVVVRHAVNAGLPLALNTGMARATGDYLTWTSDDNLYSPEAIGTMLEASVESGYPFVYADYAYFTGDVPAHACPRRLPEHFDPTTGETVGACFLYARLIYDTLGGYDAETILAEDYDYWIRVWQRFPMMHIAHPLYYYRYHEQSLTVKYAKTYIREVTSILVRLKHGVITQEAALRYCLEQKAFSLRQHSWPIHLLGKAIALFSLKRVRWSTLYRIGISLAGAATVECLQGILQSFAEQKRSFLEARDAIVDWIGCAPPVSKGE